MQKGEGSRRLGNRRHAKEAGNWAEVGPGRSAQPTLGLVASPFDLAAIRAIYSPRVESHASIHSSSAAKEKRREGHHLREECRMDLPRPTTLVGTRTDYSVGPWDYLTCAARYPMA
jgi:ketosteroid isomerase-like protein